MDIGGKRMGFKSSIRSRIISVTTIFKFIILVKDIFVWDAMRKIKGNELPV